MQRLLFNTTISLIFCITTTACGRVGKGIQIKMEPVKEYLVSDSVTKLQKATNNDTLNYDTKNPYIIIEAVTNETLARFGKAVLGVATVGGHQCKIQIAYRTFSYPQDWIDSVVWHEIGHCFYLEHSTDDEDIMYKYARPLSWYSTEVLSNFFRRLYEASH